jgi:hypothetical protein
VGLECNLNVSTNNCGAAAADLAHQHSAYTDSERANLLIENTAEFAYSGGEIVAATRAIRTINRFRILMRNLLQHHDKLSPLMETS